MSDKQSVTFEEPTFHEAYAALVAGLSPSQLREAHKRLMKCKQPLTAEEIVGEHPRIQASLEKICEAYKRKKTRSAVASKARRDDARGKIGARPAASSEPTAVDDAVGAESLVSSLSACTVECVSDAVDTEDVPVVPVVVRVVVPVVLPEEAPEPSSTKPSRPKRCLVLPAVPAAAAIASEAKSLAKKASGSTLVSRRR